jgi:hypothetical protein
MARAYAFILTLSAVALTIAVALSAVRPLEQGPVYSVAAVHTRLARSPATWVGRVVQVRGIVVGSGCQLWPSPEITSCRGWGPGALVDRSWRTILPLTLEAPKPLPALLRRLPLAGQWLPPPQAVHWGAVATYRVQLHAAPAGSCPSPPCYEALVLDAAPGAQGE